MNLKVFLVCVFILISIPSHADGESEVLSPGETSPMDFDEKSFSFSEGCGNAQAQLSQGRIDLIFEDLVAGGLFPASRTCQFITAIDVPIGWQLELSSTASAAGLFGGRGVVSLRHAMAGFPRDPISKEFDGSDEFQIGSSYKVFGEAECGKRFEVKTEITMLVHDAESYAQVGTVEMNGQFRHLSGELIECGCPDGSIEIDGVCYDPDGNCDQYDATNSQICNNPDDNLKCDWIPEGYGDAQLENTCVSTCPAGAFEIDGVCYARNGSCEQYNSTNSNTCNNSNDNLSCDWIPEGYGNSQLENTCVSACPSDAIVISGVCYARNGSCGQYNATNTETCNNPDDNLSCDWIPESYPDSQLKNTCVSACPSGAIELEGQCYSKNGVCSQYNGTNSDVCNNNKDNLLCDWNQQTQVCYPE